MFSRTHASAASQSRTPRLPGRSGDRVEIAGYLGRSDVFDESIADFAEAYADQNEADFAEFTSAIASGRLLAVQGL
ncbi:MULTISPECIES: DUF2252 domain-containing protein [unclassified Microbacterium]|uniref:DUF2252 domain-containing protein n=1 Tax=unclassified Microbacterium TaxID=2609290 RepID=UPI00214AEDFF|nr:MULTISPECIES: DUF2252 domain-containing protein [unclassified Microbacterium]MCR2808593.1 DUF2252 domain-containing protein [Microbacterium sp. zg.B185]WIM18969.1 DUF2252 domain-containing protein [Microbacterium sp. zg-B185]